jgi:uncharacterized protein (TIGR03435 family)
MMQSLLADRFKLAIHTETKQMPLYALELTSAGKTGPKLRHYEDDPPCTSATAYSSAPPSTAPSRDFPPDTLEIPATAPCGPLGIQKVSGHVHVMARGLSLSTLASDIQFLALLDHPVLDQTGLSGTFDLTIDYLPQPGDLPGINLDSADPTAAPPLVTALKEQLGLKLESTTGPVDVLVIDHVEEPMPN